MNVQAKGYLLGAIAAASYGMNPLFALPLYEAGMTPDSVLFWRYLFALPVLAIMLIARGRHFRLEKRHLFPLIGGWHCLYVTICLSHHGCVDYDTLLSGETDQTHYPLHRDCPLWHRIALSRG